jgi:flagellar biosynthesis/type III secretory pathway chaperone
MDNTSQSGMDFAVLLAEEIDCVSKLKETLQIERDCLHGNDHERLAAVTAQKQDVVDSLSGMDKRRSALLHTAGYTNDAKGIEAFIRDQSGAVRRQLQGLWQQILELASACRQQNLVNGSIIGMSLRHCSNVMAILGGRDPRDELYGPRGNASAPNQQRRPLKA